MDKNAACRLVRDTFQNPFDRERFCRFAKELLNHFEEDTHPRKLLPDNFKDYIRSFERLGKYIDADGLRIDILIVHLAQDSTLDRARTMQRNFIARYLNGSRGGKLLDAALVAFVSPDSADWRFSLVKMEYKLDETPTGKMKAKADYTPARRMSFLVGEHETSHTAQSCLLPIIEDDEHDPTLKRIEEAFNIEKATKEFFGKYRDLFLQVVDTLDEIRESDPTIEKDFAQKNINTSDFAKKLLGQIVFLYFLQKKGWFGVMRKQEWGSGSKRFMRELFEKKHGGYENFFNDILEPLFYDALRHDRTDDDDYYPMLKCKIPFLNGGLFDPLNDYDWKETDILIPNALFSNSHKTKEGDTGTGILDVFDRYNFTVNEDEPLEKEVAVDPEMLGKVFENLLEVKDRKSKGTYYTPREIVHYMCQESLINYLATELEGKVGKEDVELLVRHGELLTENEATAFLKEQLIREGKQKTTGYKFHLAETIRDNAKLIDEKLEAIRICDPAVGSGAFPVGMMGEIIRARNTLTPYLGNGGGRTMYDFKRHAIQECLYGVDIDPGAIEIAKLRLWLSLVVDEEERSTIQPLPNLDYKLVCGNSLLGLEKNLFTNQLFNDLEGLKQKYFSETNSKKKQALKLQIDELILKLTKGHKEFDFEIYFSEVFSEKGGFDVVIGNPPYVRIQELDIAYAKKLKSAYKSATGKFDLYVCFIEKGYTIIGTSGYLCFINPNKFLTASYGVGLRRIISESKALLALVDFGDAQVFSTATNYTCILLLSKTPNSDSRYLSIRSSEDMDEYGTPRGAWKRVSLPLPTVSWSFTSDGLDTLRIKLSGTRPLGEMCDEIFQGLISGSDKIMYLRLVSAEKNVVTARSQITGKLYTLEASICHTLLKGSEVKRWTLAQTQMVALYPYFEDSNGRTLLFTEKELSSKYPLAYSYLCDFRKQLEDRGSERMDYERWYAYWNPRPFRKFKAHKLVTQVLAAKASYTIDQSGSTLFVGGGNAGVYGIIPKRGLDLKYLLGLLNSKLLDCFLKSSSTRFRGGYYSYAKRFIENLPIRIAEDNAQKDIIRLVDSILLLAEDNGYLESPDKQAKVRDCEDKIDKLVYKLYDLTPDEIKIVESTDRA